jgi:23S rRNA (adenine2030-N6)-methyltransferase
MNYRHAFHAGNFADVMKHALLVCMIAYLQRKDAALRVVDTHAGIGLYDLAAEEAKRTGEWIDGIGRLDEPLGADVEALLAPYRQVIAANRARHGAATYPGSPGIVREMLRRQDRAVFVELHQADHAVLAGRYNAVSNLKVLHLDGWTALNALIPPKEKRGIVLIDPPYEKPNELERLGGELSDAVKKWSTGVFVGWYPIKSVEAVDRVAAGLAQAIRRPMLRLELFVDRPDDPDRLNGSGLFVVNPPFILRDEAEILLPALSERLSRHGYGAYRCEPIGSSS